MSPEVHLETFGSAAISQCNGLFECMCVYVCVYVGGWECVCNFTQ